MGWLSRMFGGSGGLSNSELGAQSIGPTTQKTDSGLVVTNEKALQQPTLWACCRLLTENVCATPLHVYERVNENERRRTSDHYLYDLLKYSPNALMNPLEFREAMTLSLVLWGNAYAQVARDKSGKPVSLLPLHPDMVTTVREAGTLTYHYKTREREYIFSKDSILHIKGFGIDGTVGLSPIFYARNSLGISVSADKYASKAFSSNGRPPGFISIDRTLTPDQREKLREIYSNASVDDSGMWVFEAGASWHPIGVNPDEVQMLESRVFQLSELSRFFLIPPHLIGALDKSTSWGSGIEQQNIGFLTYVLRPYFNRWESGINHSLLSRQDFRKFYVEHGVEGFLRADSAGRAAFYASAAQNGWMTRNEIRVRENLPPMEGGNELTIQSNLMGADSQPIRQ